MTKKNKNDRSDINLSSDVLSKIEKSVLEKGLKFSPTPGEPDMNELMDDLRLFFRKMRLKAYFYDPSYKVNANRQPIMDEMSQTQPQ